MLLLTEWEGRTEKYLVAVRTPWQRTKYLSQPVRPNSVNKYFIIWLDCFKNNEIIWALNVPRLNVSYVQRVGHRWKWKIKTETKDGKQKQRTKFISFISLWKSPIIPLKIQSLCEISVSSTTHVQQWKEIRKSDNFLVIACALKKSRSNNCQKAVKNASKRD